MMRRAFRLLWRFNAIVIALAGLAAIVIGLFVLYEIAEWRTARYRVPVTASPEAGKTAEPEPELSIGNFTRVGATTVLSAPIGTGYKGGGGKFSGYGKDPVERNVVFYDLATGASQRLLPQNNAVVLNWKPLWAKEEDYRVKPPQALLFQIIEADTNGDKVLDSSDGFMLALTQPDGSGLRRLDGPFDRLLGETFTPGGEELVLMVDSRGKVEALHVDLASFAVRRSEAIAPR